MTQEPMTNREIAATNDEIPRWRIDKATDGVLLTVCDPVLVTVALHLRDEEIDDLIATLVYLRAG